MIKLKIAFRIRLKNTVHEKFYHRKEKKATPVNKQANADMNKAQEDGSLNLGNNG